MIIDLSDSVKFGVWVPRKGMCKKSFEEWGEYVWIYDDNDRVKCLGSQFCGLFGIVFTANNWVSI